MSKSMFKTDIDKIISCKNKEELKNILIDVRTKITNNRSFSFFLIKNESVSNKIREIYLYNDSIKESVYRLINDIDHSVLCKCGNICRFIDNNRGYAFFCGDRKCKFLNEQRKESIKNTFNEKYGMHPMKTDDSKNKLKNTMLNKYGHDNIMTYFSKNNMVKSPFSLKIVQEKIKNTFYEKYGGHPMQTDETFEKNLKSRVCFTDYILPSGSVMQLQGYEKYGIEFLLKKYNESDIIQGVKNINREIGFIFYFFEGKKRKYYTDFYIKSENKIYEVKSIWTYKANYEKNIEKKNACEKMGMKFEFLIFDSKGNILLV